MSLSAFQARAYQSSHPWAVEFIHEPRYLKSVTVSRVLPLCICGGGAEKELQVNTLMFCSFTTSRTSLHFLLQALTLSGPGFFWGGGGVPGPGGKCLWPISPKRLNILEWNLVD